MPRIIRLKDEEYFVGYRDGAFLFDPFGKHDPTYLKYLKAATVATPLSIPSPSSANQSDLLYRMITDRTETQVNHLMDKAHSEVLSSPVSPYILPPKRIDTSVYISQSAIDSFKSATPRPAVKGKVIPDTVSTIKAYRAWRIRRKRLIPLYDNSLDTWQPMKAAVGNCSHQQISEECQCGIHAYKVPEHLCLELSGLASKNVVIGMVELWGRYLEFEDGWRAEFAYPTELWIVLPEHEEIAAEYGCKVREIRL